jgi:hypothetical protein
MAYTINLTDGTVFATISDGTINQIASGTPSVPLITLVGKNYAGYGEFLDENFVHLLESGSNTIAPTAPLTGQLWWDKTNNVLKIYNGTTFKVISAATASASEPTSNVAGDLWFDTSNQQLKVYTGAAFLVVGPGYTSAQGTSGAIPETILNNVGATKYITSLYVNNVRVAVVFDGASFTPQASLQAAFPTIYPGMTLSASVSGAVFAGSATNSQLLDSLDSSQFMRTDTDTSTTGILRVQNNTGMFVGVSNVFNVNTTSTDANIKSNISGGNLIIQANVAGTTFNVARALGGNGTFAVSNAATVGTTLGVTGTITGGNVNTAGIVSAGGNITGGNITSPGLILGATVSANGNVIGANITVGGLITTVGNVTTAATANISTGNIIVSGKYIGDGSGLTNLGALSVGSIGNGTSTIGIAGSGGNANITVGGVSNVAVFTSTTAFFAAGIAVASIEKTPGVANLIGNIGSQSNYFNTVFAKSTSAQYADLAERYAADAILEPGTVVDLGGEKEITRSLQDLSENVFGVISTNAAYLMNAGAGDDTTHPAVAIVGRVPTTVIGKVNKGDRLVSAGNGAARAALPGEATWFNVIGRALENKESEELGTIEATVSVK